MLSPDQTNLVNQTLYVGYKNKSSSFSRLIANAMVKIDGTGSPYIFFIQVVLIRFLLGCRYDLAFAYE